MAATDEQKEGSHRGARDAGTVAGQTPSLLSIGRGGRMSLKADTRPKKAGGRLWAVAAMMKAGGRAGSGGGRRGRRGRRAARSQVERSTSAEIILMAASICDDGGVEEVEKGSDQVRTEGRAGHASHPQACLNLPTQRSSTLFLHLQNKCGPLPPRPPLPKQPNAPASSCPSCRASARPCR